MEKELKSCMGVLLRADLKGHGQFSQFLPKRVGWLTVGQIRQKCKKTSNVILIDMGYDRTEQ